MSSGASSSPRDDASSRTRRWALVVRALAVVGAVLFLAATADGASTERLFFDLWRTRYILTAVGGVVLTFIVTLRPAGLKRCMRWALVLGIAGIPLEAAGLFGVVSYGDLLNPPWRELGGKAIPHLDVQGVTYENIAWRYGYPTTPVPFHFKTDRRGLRNREDRAEADVYLLGDSALVYGLMPIEKAVGTRLEEVLERPVMNVALIGIGPQQERDLLLESGLPLEGRLVLQFISEDTDLSDSRTYRRRHAQEGEAARGSPIKRTLAYNLLLFLQDLSSTQRLPRERAIGRIGDTDYLFKRLRDTWQGLDDEFEHATAAIDDVRRAVRDAGGTYAMVLVPAKIRVLGPLCSWPEGSSLSGYREHLNPFRERLTEWCAHEGVPLLDMTTPLQQSGEAGSVPWFAGDTHQNEIGHAITARSLAEWSVVQDWRASAASGKHSPP